MVWGIVQAITSLISYLKKPTWANFGKIIQGIGIFVIGLGTAFLGLPAVIGGAIVLIVGTIIKHWEEIRAFLQNGINWLMGIGDWISAHINANLGNMFKRIVSVLQNTLNWFNTIFTSIRGIFDGLINFIKGIFTGNWQQAWEGIQQIFTGVLDIIKGTFELTINNFIDWVMAFGDLVAAIIDGIKDMFNQAWESIKQGAIDAWEGIKQTFSTVGDFFGRIFSDAWTRVKNVFSTGGQIFNGLKDGIVAAFKKIVNAIISGINRAISTPFNSLNSVLNRIKNIEIAGIKPFNWVWTVSVPQIPYLKTGGIINLPGRGVNLGGAFGGEAGREGVLPLTDQQAMAELGREIGKWIVVNATITNSMNGRLLSREIKRIENEQEFAFNS